MNKKRLMALVMVGLMLVMSCAAFTVQAEEKQKLVISTYLATDAQVAVREQFIARWQRPSRMWTSRSRCTTTGRA